MKNIVENNKMIAEFLDWEFDDLSETFETPFLKLVDPNAFGDEQYSCKLQDFELEFHSDWNWLMRVVEKISKIKGVKIEMLYVLGGLKVKINVCGHNNWSNPNHIEAVHNACVEFIKWYNELNKSYEKNKRT